MRAQRRNHLDRRRRALPGGPCRYRATSRAAGNAAVQQQYWRSDGALFATQCRGLAHILRTCRIFRRAPPCRRTTPVGACGTLAGGDALTGGVTALKAVVDPVAAGGGVQGGSRGRRARDADDDEGYLIVARKRRPVQSMCVACRQLVTTGFNRPPCPSGVLCPWAPLPLNFVRGRLEGKGVEKQQVDWLVADGGRRSRRRHGCHPRSAWCPSCRCHGSRLRPCYAPARFGRSRWSRPSRRSRGRA